MYEIAVERVKLASKILFDAHLTASYMESKGKIALLRVDGILIAGLHVSDLYKTYVKRKEAFPVFSTAESFDQSRDRLATKQLLVVKTSSIIHHYVVFREQHKNT